MTLSLTIANVIMLSLVFFIVMLSVIMVFVIVLSVVKPFHLPRKINLVGVNYIKQYAQFVMVPA
jgi:hypothetical protein